VSNLVSRFIFVLTGYQPRTVAYILALAVYMTVTIPALRTIVTPHKEDTRDVRIEAMRVLSAGNTIIVVILAGVLLLQVSLNFVDRVLANIFSS
jgi:hypothetical protein